ncbi:MAG: hypothetical protein ACYC6Z_11320 [Thermoleophilia bacterium]
MKTRNLNIPIVFVIAIMLLTLASGCGSESSAGGVNSSAGDQGVAGGSSKTADKIDACGVVTQEDAAKIFSNPATRSEGALVVDPNMLGECEWSHDADMNSQLIQFRVWNGEKYYGPSNDSKPLDVGDKGVISVNQYTGVDMQWVQDGKTVELSYFTTGPGAPEASAKTEEMKALAKQAAAKL